MGLATYHISHIKYHVTYHIMSYHLTHRKALVAFYDIDDSSAYDTISTAVTRNPPRARRSSSQQGRARHRAPPPAARARRRAPAGRRGSAARRRRPGTEHARHSHSRLTLPTSYNREHVMMQRHCTREGERGRRRGALARPWSQLRRAAAPRVARDEKCGGRAEAPARPWRQTRRRAGPRHPPAASGRARRRLPPRRPRRGPSPRARKALVSSLVHPLSHAKFG